MNNFFDPNENIKKRIENNVHEAVREYSSRDDITTNFGATIIGYASCEDPIFLDAYERKICRHPKEIFRPGNSIICHFTPYGDEIAKSNCGGIMPSEKWEMAFSESTNLIMLLNRVISDTLDEVGRLHSATDVPFNWNRDTHRQNWSHKLAAYAAGMGRFGCGGSFITQEGSAGRWGSVITDGKYALEDHDNKEDDPIATIERDCAYAQGNSDAEGLKEKCPAHAVDDGIIDRKKCEEWCLKINETFPAPEVCGKCFPLIYKEK